jgi:hypothetical protein
MIRKLSRFVVALAILIAGLGANTARADFYSLEGQFACLEHATATCVDMGSVTEKPQSDSKPTAAPSLPTLAAPTIQAPVLTSTAQGQVQKSAPSDPFLDIAGRIKTGKISSEDLQRLRIGSHAGDGRAIELLAWCDYFGIGLPRDPVAAYILYGIAGLAGISGTSTNQAIIYDYGLSSDQRQIVLDIANDEDFATTH